MSVKKDKMNGAARGGGLGQEKKTSIVSKTVIRKRFEGIATSDAMDKTIVVRVDSVKVHSKYGKRFTVSKKYKVHDESNKFKTGDRVAFTECRPYSKDKRWRTVSSK